uniref:Homeobox domain-containing protein n=1 Tax=Araucaria cunninghamii TaxID=56994 RepID=A0A0D6QXF5_ARACU
MEVSGGGSGEDQDAGEQLQQPRKKRYHRHTARQIQELEAMFKECPHPDEKQRLQLSKDLGLEPRQVKFWFQNRRTQMKAQHERADNSVLRSENEKIRCENIAIREALKNVICPNCGGPSSEMSFEGQQQLRMENARLREELDRLSSIAAKYIGRPIQQLGPLQPIPMPSVDLAVGGYGMQNAGPSSSEIMAGHSLSEMASLQTGSVSELEKSLMVELAVNAMEELVRLAQTDEPLWVKNVNENKEVLSLEAYGKLFPRAAEPKAYHVRKEATRDSGLVIINGNALVDIFMDVNKWAEMFSTIVSKAKTLEVLSSGMPGNRHDSLQLMCAELQVLSPLVSTREIYFLRYCQHHAEGLWAVVDVSVDSLKELNININQQSSSLLRCRKFPSGCVIQDMPNGYSKVTWVEHVEPEDRAVHRMYRQLVQSGTAFGAQRWLAMLQRMCERLASLLVNNISARELGVIPSPEGRRSMMKLAQRMMSSFCANVSASTSHRWTTLSGSSEDGVRVATRKSTDPGQPNGVVLCAATSLWLPVPTHRVFDFFRDEQMRSEWDVLSSGNLVQEVAHIANGSHPGNCISLLRACNASQNNMLILQESCTDASGSLVVYAPVDVSAINMAMSGEDPSYIALLPSGFAIVPDGSENKGALLQASTSDISSGGFDISGRSNGNVGGSLITVAFQILVSNLPSAKLNLESITTVNNLICNTVQQIKTALHCADA